MTSWEPDMTVLTHLPELTPNLRATSHEYSPGLVTNEHLSLQYLFPPR